ncbi:hypothetical protein CIC12_05775 [Burkholderia sp. SG-MS1]|nr:hypothetical protein [Paraburkholderia sp. SG-MS1]
MHLPRSTICTSKDRKPDCAMPLASLMRHQFSGSVPIDRRNRPDAFSFHSMSRTLLLFLLCASAMGREPAH